jgi:hypothetical protein
MGEWLDPSSIPTSNRRTVSGGLVIVRAMQIIVPLVVAHTLNVVSVFMTALNLTACILGMNSLIGFLRLDSGCAPTQRLMSCWQSSLVGFSDGRDPDPATQLQGSGLDLSSWLHQALCAVV